MLTERRSWPVIIGSAVAGGAFFYLAMTAVYRFVLGDSWDWERAAGAALALTLVWAGIGAFTRWRWIPPSRRHDESDRTT